MAPLKDDLAFCEHMASDAVLWQHGIELMQPFANIRDRGTFPVPAKIPDGLIETALKPFISQTGEKVHRLNGRMDKSPASENSLLDLTDILRGSPLKEDIPRNHLFTGIFYHLGHIFLSEEPYNDDPERRNRKHFGHALQGALTRGYPFRGKRLKTLEYNYGGLWVHLLWHALKGRTENVDTLKPLCELMALAPILGFERTTQRWIICTPSVS